jgi:hypothetical protein
MVIKNLCMFQLKKLGSHLCLFYISVSQPKLLRDPFFPRLKTLGHWTQSLQANFYPSSLPPHLKNIFRDCLRSYNKIKYVFLGNLFQLRKEKCSLTFLCYFLATRLKSSTSRYWVATRWLRNPGSLANYFQTNSKVVHQPRKTLAIC